MSNNYQPDPKLKFTFGLWTVGNIGRDPFGGPVRDVISPVEICDLLGEVGAYGVNFHDNDLVPIDADATQRDDIVRSFKKALRNNGLVVPMATTNLFSDPGLQGRRVHQQQRPNPRLRDPEDDAGDGPRGRMRGEDLRLLGRPRRRRIRRHEKPRRIHQAFPRGDQLSCANTASTRNTDTRFAFEAKPNEPRGHIYFAVTGSYLGFIPTLDHPEMCGVNPEVAHEHMAGLNFVHQVAAALEAGKLFHIDLNDQEFGRYDQDFRFGSVNLKHAFFLVKLLEDQRLRRPAPFRRPCLSPERLRRCEGIRPRLHEDVHDPERKSPAMERRPRNPADHQIGQRSGRGVIQADGEIFKIQRPQIVWMPRWTALNWPPPRCPTNGSTS